MDNKIPQPNYVRKILSLRRLGLIPDGIVPIDVLHDEWCHHWTGGRCNCDPDIRLTPVPDPRRH